MDKAEQVVGAYMAAFPKCADYHHRPDIGEVERVMRPFAPISYEVQQQIDHLFHERGASSTTTGEHCWWEADFAVSGDGPHHAFVANFLAGDPCTCTVPHLESAIANSTKQDIDPRLRKLCDLWISCGRDELEFHKRLYGRS